MGEQAKQTALEAADVAIKAALRAAANEDAAALVA
jgi:hypothetical protein